MEMKTSTHVQPIWDDSHRMKALQFRGCRMVELNYVPVPTITDETDAIVRISLTTICGSDLHLYRNQIPQTKSGDILGHEAVGVVVKVGKQVKEMKIGMRVAVSAVIACGSCRYCKMNRFSNCDTTNPSGAMEKMYGHRTAGLFGYSHLTGGYPGLQAEFARVPFADLNLLPLNDQLSNEEAILLSDVACTAYQAALYGEVGIDDDHKVVAIWGAGPIGLCSAYHARKLGATRIIMIDNIDSRLKMAAAIGCETINYDYVSDIPRRLRELTGEGPDVAIDATGFRYSKSLKHAVEATLYLETDSIDALTEAITAVRKSGIVSIIGDYIGFANHFPIGAVMEKGLTIRSGQLHCQAYWRELQEKMVKHEIDLKWLITHKMKIEDIIRGYAAFDRKENGIVKAVFSMQ